MVTKWSFCTSLNLITATFVLISFIYRNTRARAGHLTDGGTNTRCKERQEEMQQPLVITSFHGMLEIYSKDLNTSHKFSYFKAHIPDLMEKLSHSLYLYKTL